MALEYQSRCISVDGDATNGIPSQGFGIQYRRFGRTSGAFTTDGANTTIRLRINGLTALIALQSPCPHNFYKDFERDDFPLVYQLPLQYNMDGTYKDRVRWVAEEETDADLKLRSELEQVLEQRKKTESENIMGRREDDVKMGGME